MKVLTIDIGGTFIKYALMREDMSFLERGKIKTPQDGREALIEAIGEIYDNLSGIDGIAISMPGIIDREKDFCLMGGAIRYNDGFFLKESLEKRCPVKIVMENDAKCAAMAEATEGSLKDVDDGFVLIFGTMIGGAFIKNRTLHRGKHFSAGEVSYINTSTNGMPTFSNVWGNRSGASGLCRMYAEKLDIPEKDVNGEMVFEEVEKGTPAAIECLDSFTMEIAVQLFNIQTVLDPERFAIGGGISEQPAFIAYIQKNLSILYEECPYCVPHAEVVTCTFHNDANLIGALKCYLEENGEKYDKKS